MSQMDCSKVEDEPMIKNTEQSSDLIMIQVDLIQMDDKPADSCAMSLTAFLFLFLFLFREYIMFKIKVLNSSVFC